MDSKNTESCGRCSMTTVIDAVSSGDSESQSRRDPFNGDRIEVDEDQIRRISPAAWIGGITERIDDAATNFVYGNKR